MNRSNSKDKLCIVLAGYKSFLYESVFDRLTKYVNDDIDVCIITSGLYSKEISSICEKNNWSYLSTKENNVCLVQNLAIELHKSANYIFKLDEDIFITKDYFKKMYDAFLRIKKTGNYQIGFLAPLIPINGYGHLRLLQKLNLVEYYTNKFEKPTFAADPNKMIENNCDVAKFFWGENHIIPPIDELNEDFGKENFSYTICPIRFSIGAILFTREEFMRMGMFPVGRRNSNSLGSDEVRFCVYCMKESRIIAVADNVVVGHLSFGNQNAEMKKYYLENKDKFLTPQN